MTAFRVQYFRCFKKTACQSAETVVVVVANRYSVDLLVLHRNMHFLQNNPQQFVKYVFLVSSRNTGSNPEIELQLIYNRIILCTVSKILLSKLVTKLLLIIVYFHYRKSRSSVGVKVKATRLVLLNLPIKGRLN